MVEVREMLGTFGQKNGVRVDQETSTALVTISTGIEARLTPAQCRHLAQNLYRVARNIERARSSLTPDKTGERQEGPYGGTWQSVE